MAVVSKSKNAVLFMEKYKSLDIKKIREASKVFLGVHDFRNFCSGEKDNYITCIKKINIYKIGKHIYIRFVGAGFYRYMVRNLVGALVEVGKGKISSNELQDILDNKVNKRLNTALANGLYLINVRY